MGEQVRVSEEIQFDDEQFEPEVIESFDSVDKDYLVDDKGVEVDANSLLEEEEDYGIVSDDSSFISDTGDIVVMDSLDNGENFELIYTDIKNIGVVPRIRKVDNVEALVKSIQSTGLLNPVIVAPTSTDGFYVLLHGMRRLMACALAGKRNIPCVVNNKVSTPEIPILEAIYNHSKAYTIREIVDYIDYLEKQKGIMSSTMIEYLLQLNPGDYTKLKDILNDDDEDIVSKLFDGTYTIEAAFRKLEQRRKKESAEERDLKKAEKVYTDTVASGADNIEGSGEETDSDFLSTEELKELTESAKNVLETEDEDIEDLLKEANDIEGYKPHRQDPNERERLDPALRKSVLARDKNTCQICSQISGQEYIEVLDVHHIIEVYLGGTDDIDNLITACTVCHKLVHLFARGELYIRPLEELTDEEKEKFIKVIKLGTIIRKGMADRKMSKEALKKLDKAETIGRRLKGSSDQVAG